MEEINMNKNKFRKFISGVTAILMTVCCVPSSASAINVTGMIDYDTLTETDINLAMQTSIPRMIWALENKPEYLGIEVNGTVEISDYFTIADIENGILHENKSIVYYPISVDNDIVLLLHL